LDEGIVGGRGGGGEGESDVAGSVGGESVGVDGGEGAVGGGLAEGVWSELVAA